jgi:hypothetical protein
MLTILHSNHLLRGLRHDDATGCPCLINQGSKQAKNIVTTQFLEETSQQPTL